jgi:hypothetical protein
MLEDVVEQSLMKRRFVVARAERPRDLGDILIDTEIAQAPETKATRRPLGEHQWRNANELALTAHRQYEEPVARRQLLSREVPPPRHVPLPARKRKGSRGILEPAPGGLEIVQAVDGRDNVDS